MNYILIDDFTNMHFKGAFISYFEELGININNWDKLFNQMNEEIGNLAYLAVDGASVVGFLQFRIDVLNNWFFTENFGFIREFWVKVQHRNTGIGSELIKHTEQYLLSKSINRVILTSDTAEHFYLTHGYHLDSSYIPRNELPVFVKTL